jgi:hypothetical protein
LDAALFRGSFMQFIIGLFILLFVVLFFVAYAITVEFDKNELPKIVGAALGASFSAAVAILLFYVVVKCAELLIWAVILGKPLLCAIVITSRSKALPKPRFRHSRATATDDKYIVSS